MVTPEHPSCRKIMGWRTLGDCGSWSREKAAALLRRRNMK